MIEAEDAILIKSVEKREDLGSVGEWNLSPKSKRFRLVEKFPGYSEM